MKTTLCSSPVVNSLLNMYLNYIVIGLPSPIECWKEWPMKHLDPSFSFDSHKVKITTRDRQSMDACTNIFKYFSL